MSISKEELTQIIIAESDKLFQQKLKNKQEVGFDNTQESENMYYGLPDEDTEVMEGVFNSEDTFADFDEFTEEIVEPIKEENGEPAKVIKFPTREAFFNHYHWREEETTHEEPVNYDDIVKQMAVDTENQVRNEEFLANCEASVLNILNNYNSKACQKHMRSAYNSERTNRHTNDKTMYKKDTVMMNGKETKFTRVKETPNWSIDFQECLTNDDKARNFDQLRIKITDAIFNYYGGFTRMNTIIVRNYQLIINGVCYMPVFSNSMLEKFPFDVADYVREGCLAPLLDWGYLTKMTSLKILSFDTIEFVMTYVSEDLGAGRVFSPIGLFSICKNLEILEIDGEVVTYPLENEKTVKRVQRIEDNAKSCSRFNRVYDVYTDNVCNKFFGGARRWTFNNLVNYANNRGNKNIFMYTGGIISRGIVSGAAGTLELGARTVGGITKGVVGLFKRAVSEVHRKD